MAISILVIVDVVSRHKIKQLHQILTTDNEFRSNSTRALMSENSLLDGIARCLEDKEVLERVNILAHTSNVYYQAIAKSKVRIRYLRLLLRKMDSIDDMQLPEDQANRELIRNRQKAQVEEWQRLARQGKIERIDVAFYPFEPMVHMLIVDSKHAVFGINSLEHGFPGVSSATHDSFVVNGQAEDGRIFISNLEASFDQIWNEFSVPRS